MPRKPERERGIRRVRAPVLASLLLLRRRPRRGRPRGHERRGRHRRPDQDVQRVAQADDRPHGAGGELAVASGERDHGLRWRRGEAGLRTGAVHQGSQRVSVLRVPLLRGRAAHGNLQRPDRRCHQGVQLLRQIPAWRLRHHPPT